MIKPITFLTFVFLVLSAPLNPKKIVIALNCGST